MIGKEYNPCGDLTGRERALCDEAAKNFYNLPFYEVMRAVSVKAIADLEHEENFRNVDALKNWADYNLMIRSRACRRGFANIWCMSSTKTVTIFITTRLQIFAASLTKKISLPL